MSSILLKQHNNITEARYDLSALEKNIVYILLSASENKIPPNFQYYRIYIYDLQDRLDKEITPDEMLEVAKNLVTRTYNFHSTEGEVQSSMLSPVYEFWSKEYIEVVVGEIMQSYLIRLKENGVFSKVRIHIFKKSRAAFLV